MWSVATSKCLCLAKEVKELVHLVFFFSLERQFHANEKCSKRIIQRIQDLLGKELCSGVLSVMATVLCNLSRLGHPSLCWTRGCEPESQSAAPVTTLTSSWSRCPVALYESVTVLADIWYLSCTSRYYENSSHDQQPQPCCYTSPISFQGEGKALPQAHVSNSAENVSGVIP